MTYKLYTSCWTRSGNLNAHMRCDNRCVLSECLGAASASLRLQCRVANRKMSGTALQRE